MSPLVVSVKGDTASVAVKLNQTRRSCCFFRHCGFFEDSGLSFRLRNEKQNTNPKSFEIPDWFFPHIPLKPLAELASHESRTLTLGILTATMKISTWLAKTPASVRAQVGGGFQVPLLDPHIWLEGNSFSK